MNLFRGKLRSPRLNPSLRETRGERLLAEAAAAPVAKGETAEGELKLN